MLKRNLTILILTILTITIVIFGFSYFRGGTTPSGDDGKGTNFFSQFNPFRNRGQNPPSETPPPGTEEGSGEQGEQNTQTILNKVSSMPIAGFTIFNKERLKDVPIIAPVAIEENPPTGTGENPEVKKPTKVTATPTAPLTEFVPAVRYVDRVTGNIFQTFADKLEERKFSVTVIPRVHEAFFGNSGQSVVMRYLKADEQTIETFVGNLPKEVLGGDTTENNEVRGSLLPDGISNVSLSPDTSKLFYLSTVGENMKGTIYSFIDNKKTQVFDSPFTEWLPFWHAPSTITLSTNPSWNTLGYMYTISLNNKNSFTKSLGEINGLTTLVSPDGKLVLFGDNNLAIGVYNTDSRTTTSLGIRTLPEKCVWGKSGNTLYCSVPKFIDPLLYPDAWYQGEASFSDTFWRINVPIGETTQILDPSTLLVEEIDGIKLATDSDEKYLFFVNKKDSFLWRLELK